MTEIEQELIKGLKSYLYNCSYEPDLSLLSFSQLKYILASSYRYLLEKEMNPTDIYHLLTNRYTIQEEDLTIFDEIISTVVYSVKQVTSNVALAIRDRILNNKDLIDQLALRLFNKYGLRNDYYDLLENVGGVMGLTVYYLKSYDGNLLDTFLVDMMGLDVTMHNIYQKPKELQYCCIAYDEILSTQEINDAENFYKYFILKNILEEIEY